MSSNTDRFTTRQLDAMIALERAFERCAKHGISFAIYSGGPFSMGMYAMTDQEYNDHIGDQSTQIDIGELTHHWDTIKDVGGV